jgi:hypothetical protein
MNPQVETLASLQAFREVFHFNPAVCRVERTVAMVAIQTERAESEQVAKDKRIDVGDLIEGEPHSLELGVESEQVLFDYSQLVVVEDERLELCEGSHVRLVDKSELCPDESDGFETPKEFVDILREKSDTREGAHVDGHNLFVSHVNQVSTTD